MVDQDMLILRVEKPIWLAMSSPIAEIDSKMIGWTTIKPTYDNGFIDKNSVLVFNHIYPGTEGEEGLNFIEISPGNIPTVHMPEFFKKEIESLIQEGVLKPLLEPMDFDEMTIVSGNVLFKQSWSSSFDETFFVPEDIYVIMGDEQSDLSNYHIKTGDKVSLKHILDVYSRSMTRT